MAFSRAFSFICLFAFVVVATGCPGNRPLEDAENRYFVDGANGSDGNSGQRAAPLATIGEGISRVADTGGEVIVAGGVYDETIGLVSNLTLRGGFDPNEWVQDLNTFESEIGPGTDDRTVIFGDDDTDVVIEGFTIVAAGGNSYSIPVQIIDCDNISVRDNFIVAGMGGDGLPVGVPPRTGNGDDGSDGRGVRACLPNADPAAGGSGGSGNAGDNGGNGGRGGTEGVNAQPGQGGDGPFRGSGGGFATPGVDAEDGNDATDYPGIAPAGDGGAAFGQLRDFGAVYLPANGEIGDDGAPGSGGGGGGGGRQGFGTCGGSGGGGGEGGTGGFGGNGGRGGGASIGIALVNATNMDIRNNDIVTMGGGDGGDGNSGGPGGFGGRGGEGGGSLVGSELAGGDGGDGGNGQQGGFGGGGGGGPSVGIAEDAASTSTRRFNNFDIGPGGAPGQGASSAAPAAFGLEAAFYKES